jgi:small subunit ribosomal protein S8
MVNDPIADMLTRIRNALMIGRDTVEIPASKLKVEIARILKEEGYIEDYSLVEQQPFSLINVQLKYFGARRQRTPVITHLERVSKPGRRVYRGRKELPLIQSGMGIAIVTTPKGVMTAAQARRERTGGEVLCYVW